MSNAPAPLDTTRRFVRVFGERRGGFIEFEFAVGEPEVFIEMLLSPAAFSEFCATNKVEILPPRDPDAVPQDFDWRLSDVTRFKTHSK